MMGDWAHEVLEAVRAGELSVDDALARLKTSPFVDLGFAKVDTHRALRQGVPEVVFGEGKTAAQIVGIVRALAGEGSGNGDRTDLRGARVPILVTRLSGAKAAEVAREVELDYRAEARMGIVGAVPEPDGNGRIAVVSGGTSDQPVAEEAAVTAEALGNEVVRLYDVGLAGLHRLLAHQGVLASASAIIAVAGMEGALASVVGGLVDCPVVAVPTSVGYGASLGGLAALLAMLNSCASGVGVVNIDNGFGAGFLASRINHAKAGRA